MLVWQSNIAVCTPSGFGAAAVLGSADPKQQSIKTTLAKVVETPRARLHSLVLLDFMGTSVFKEMRMEMYMMILRQEGCSSSKSETWRKEIQYWWDSKSEFKFLQPKIPLMTMVLPSALSALQQ